MSTPPFLPTTRAEIDQLGWSDPDIVLVSGDAYIDHPSFAAAILGRWLEHNGYRVAILAQPDWRSADAWRQLGRPRLFYGVTAGNMDSMINHYTANKKRRNSDAYSPGGAIGLRPDRATTPYAQRCREAFKGVPVVAGGVEASLRRLAHYDYWSDTVKPSILATSKADLVVFGMGERQILEIATRLDRGDSIQQLRDIRGVSYLLGRNEMVPDYDWSDSAGPGGDLELPSFEEVKSHRRAFCQMTTIIHRESNPHNGRRLLQVHGDRQAVVNPASLPLSEEQMDALYSLPYTRRPHPSYSEAIPAWEMIRDSVQIMRGCFGGCTFCSITLHQGRTIQNRSRGSILAEIKHIASDREFKGHISDLGGPTANMYRMGCTDPDIQARCRRLSCVHPTICSMLDTSHQDLVQLMRDARSVEGVKKINIASGLRMDLAGAESTYLNELVRHHVGGHLKVAPEHTSDRVLAAMKKPAQKTFETFARVFAAATKRIGKEQYLVPYFIASHPGCTITDMIDLAVFLKTSGLRPQQVQDFIPAPMDIATCMYHTGLDPHTMKPIFSAKKTTEREAQRALLQFFKPENYHQVKDILIDSGREDLIGNDPTCLISANPPAGAWRSSQHNRKERSRNRHGYRRSARGGPKRGKR